MKNLDFLLKNLDFLLKNLDFHIQSGDLRCRARAVECREQKRRDTFRLPARPSGYLPGLQRSRLPAAARPWGKHKHTHTATFNRSLSAHGWILRGWLCLWLCLCVSVGPRSARGGRGQVNLSLKMMNFVSKSMKFVIQLTKIALKMNTNDIILMQTSSQAAASRAFAIKNLRDSQVISCQKWWIWCCKRWISCWKWWISTKDYDGFAPDVSLRWVLAINLSVWSSFEYRISRFDTEYLVFNTKFIILQVWSVNRGAVWYGNNMVAICIKIDEFFIQNDGFCASIMIFMQTSRSTTVRKGWWILYKNWEIVE